MEVLIATIILGMSMGIVFYALRSVEDTRCVASIKANTVALQNAMLDVALGSPPTQRRVVFTLPQCGDKSVEALRFVYYRKSEYCRSCPGQYSGCWILEPTVYDLKAKKIYTLADAATCVNMPADIDLAPLSSTSGRPECLGDADHMTCTPCPKYRPDGTAISLADCISGRNSVSGIPSSVYAPSAIAACDTRNSNSVWQTFGRKRGDPRTFIFELSKSTAPGGTGVINICPTLK